MLDPAPFAGPIAVTLVYCLLFYAFMIRQARVRFARAADYASRGEKFDRYFTPDREMLAADRTMLNMLEHMPPFLALLWLDAVFVSPTSATIAGGVYVAARAAYPLLMGGRLGRSVPARILLATVTGYVVLGWFVVSLAKVILVGRG